MHTNRRTGYHHGDLRPALLGKATELLDAHGIEGLTIRAVARAANVSHAAPINHFATRADLLSALAATYFEYLARTVAERIEGIGDDAVPRVEAFVDVFLAYALEYPHRYRLLWRRDLLSAQDERMNEAMDKIYDHLVAEIDRARPSSGASPHTYATALWSMTHGYISMRLDGNMVAMDDEVLKLPRHRAMVALIMGKAQ